MAANERLRTLMLQRGETIQSLATLTKVDPKTVERWISTNRLPYTRHRMEIAKHLDVELSYLWPNAVSREQLASVSGSEIITVHPHRWAVGREAFARLFDEAEEEIGILVYSGLFIAEDAGIREMLRSKASDGVNVRILLGDPDSPQLNVRGADEGIDDSLAGKVRNATKLLRPLADDGVEIRVHSTTLYNSIYRADDQLLVNTHVYGVGASEAPVMHLRRVMGGKMVTTYLESFERVWATAQPLPART